MSVFPSGRARAHASSEESFAIRQADKANYGLKRVVASEPSESYATQKTDIPKQP